MASFSEEDESARYIERLALSVGASEPALRILISILIGFPVALFHRYNLYGKCPEFQHVYFIVCGFCIGLFNYGLDFFHTLGTILVIYILLKTAGGSQLSAILTLVLTMGYLLTGYYLTSTDTYDIKWTLPQCVLTLRLSGLAFDLYDGSQPEESLSAGSKKVALKQMPSLLEILAYSYFPTSFLVGPQFPMKRYQEFVDGKFRSPGRNDQPPDCLTPALYRFLTGVFYLTVFQGASMYYSDNYLIGEDFENSSLLHRWFHLSIWGHVVLYKYISCWLLCESVCITTGITYNGTDSDGSTKWDGCANVNLKVFEGATNFGHYIESFNINTNQWVFQYIYKRLKFLGNKYYSQIGVLLFLALWHGFHSGYYVTFFLEFICMAMEKDLTVILNRNKSFLLFLQRPGVKHLTWAVLKMYTLIFMGYCMAPFVLLSVQKWFRVYCSVFFVGHVVWMGWPAYRPIVKLLLPAAREHKE